MANTVPDFEVEQVLGQRRRGRAVEFLVRWRGYGEEQDSWEPLKNLKTCQNIVDAFKEAQAAKKNQGRGRSRTTKVTASSRSRSRSSSRARSKSATRRSTRGRMKTKEPPSELPPAMSTFEKETKTERVTQVVTQQKQETSQTTEMETVTVSRTESSTTNTPKKSSCPVDTRHLLNLRLNDVPLIIVVACLAFIFISVFLMKKPSN